MMVAARRDEAAPCGGEGVGMRLGIVTPVVNLNPRFDPPQWEERGGIEDVVEVARAAERTGYEWVSCPEHVAIPSAAAGTRGGRYWDPVTTLAFVAASTQSIGLLSHVVVLGYHHPLEIVKRYGTLDVLSGGASSSGWVSGRCRRSSTSSGCPSWAAGTAPTTPCAPSASFSRRVPSYSGTHYAFEGFVVEPSGVQPRVPLWVGGRTRRSLQRALELGDGWIPFGLPLDGLRALLTDAAAAMEEREASLDVVPPPNRPSIPSASPTRPPPPCAPMATWGPRPWRCASATRRAPITSSSSRP